MKFYTMKLQELSEESTDPVYIMPFQQSDVELHDHNFFELAYITGGSAWQNLAGKKERVKTGDYFIIDYGAVHSYQECNNFTLINCLFLPEAIDDVLEGFDRVVGLSKLKAIHLNDSKNPFESHKDRHEKIGEGSLGLAAFERIVTHPALAGLPFYLETPNELDGYAREIALLRGFVK